MASYKCTLILIPISVATYFKLDKAYDYLDQSPRGICKVQNSFLIKHIFSQDSLIDAEISG